MATLSEVVKLQNKKAKREVETWEAQEAAYLLKRVAEIKNDKELIKAAKAHLKAEAKALEKAIKGSD